MNELKVDKSLLISNFDTYKLSLEKFPISKQNIPGGIGIKYPNEDQFSFLHHKEFTFHNHLYGDAWNENDVYFITAERKVKKGLVNFQTEKLFGLIDVWEIPEHSCDSACNFNASLNFPSHDTAVITDGHGFLYIVETSSRSEVRQWKTLHTEEMSGNGKEFKVTCNLLVNGTNGRKLHCLLLFVEKANSESSSHIQISGFETVLKWVLFTEDGRKWSKTIVNEWRGRGSVDYISLEPEGQALYLISDSEFVSPQIAREERHLHQSNGTALPEPDYHWQQSLEEVKVWIEIPSDNDKSHLKIETKNNYLNVCLKESFLLFGTLFQRIDPDCTTWSLNSSKLEIVMQKEKVGLVWSCLLNCSDKIGKEIINEEFVAEVHEKLAHLCSENEEQGDVAMLNSGELEDCDAFGQNRYLRRYDKSGKNTHKIFLGSDQWLFSLKMASDRLPAFCIRRDVDGLMWQPVEPKDDSNLFECTHIHTFPALGYIVASKVDKKFLIVPPNLSYAAVVNSMGHVIMFRKTNLPGSSELRNRKTNEIKSSLFVQNLINIDSNYQIFGAQACSKYLFVLTSKELMMVSVNIT